MLFEYFCGMRVLALTSCMTERFARNKSLSGSRVHTSCDDDEEWFSNFDMVSFFVGSAPQGRDYWMMKS
jgi:hypothetical protein